jgi:hypothetical protein
MEPFLALMSGGPSQQVKQSNTHFKLQAIGGQLSVHLD